MAKKSKPINTKIINEIMAKIKFKPADHEMLQVLDNTMSSDNLLALAKAKFYEVESARKLGDKKDAHKHLVQHIRLLVLAEYHMIEEDLADASTLD